jgi:hypothetical protein
LIGFENASDDKDNTTNVCNQSATNRAIFLDFNRREYLNKFNVSKYVLFAKTQQKRSNSGLASISKYIIKMILNFSMDFPTYFKMGAFTVVTG